jgi:formiminotetrahydrofolate cyclodeaminase
VTEGHLVDLSVTDFVARVAAADHAVPAGGSVAALTAASSAALLALVCGVLERKPGSPAADRRLTAQRLLRNLLGLVDEDADAFAAFLHARRAPQQGGLRSAVARTSRVPLSIASGCIDVIDLSHVIEVDASGPMLADVRAARLLAAAALRTVLEIAVQNLDLMEDGAERERLRAEISRLRSPRDHGEKSP